MGERSLNRGQTETLVDHKRVTNGDRGGNKPPLPCPFHGSIAFVSTIATYSVSPGFQSLRAISSQLVCYSSAPTPPPPPCGALNPLFSFLFLFYFFLSFFIYLPSLPFCYIKWCFNKRWGETQKRHGEPQSLWGSQKGSPFIILLIALSFLYFSFSFFVMYYNNRNKCIKWR